MSLGRIGVLMGAIQSKNDPNRTCIGAFIIGRMIPDLQVQKTQLKGQKGRWNLKIWLNVFLGDSAILVYTP